MTTVFRKATNHDDAMIREFLEGEFCPECLGKRVECDAYEIDDEHATDRTAFVANCWDCEFEAEQVRENATGEVVSDEQFKRWKTDKYDHLLDSPTIPAPADAGEWYANQRKKADHWRGRLRAARRENAPREVLAILDERLESALYVGD